MTETQQKLVEEWWAIKLTTSNGDPFFSFSREGGECRCTFSSREKAEQRIFEWEQWLKDAKPKVVRVEIREL